VAAPDPETEARQMSYLVEFPTEQEGQTVIVELGDDQLAGFAPAAVSPGQVAARATASFEEALDRLLPTVKKIGDRMQALAPDECTVELGVKLTAEAGVIISKAAAEANFTLTLTWTKDGSQQSA
jgi:hypothetical protein